jgi:hypothetical protein
MTKRVILSGIVHATNDAGWLDVEIENVGRYWVPGSAVAEDREIWGLAETAAYLGVPKPRLINWGNRNTHDYPTPFLRLGCGSHQRAETVRLWAEANARHLGPEASAWADLPAELRKALHP